MTAEHECELLLKRLTKTGGGIVLLPELLHALKCRGTSVVHIVPAGALSTRVKYERRYLRACRRVARLNG